jgi:AraC family transcriptional regulator
MGLQLVKASAPGESGHSIDEAEVYASGTDKYGADGLLASSVGLGWKGLSATLFSHGSGVMEWKNVQRDTELCIDLQGSRSTVTRLGGGIIDKTVAGEPGTIWMTPGGLKEDLLEISHAMPKVLHLYLPASHFSPESIGVDVDQSVVDSLRFERSFRDPLISAIAQAISSELELQTSTGSMLTETLAASLAARLLHNHGRRTDTEVVSRGMLEGLDRRRLARVLEYIDANIEGRLTIDELASIACLSRFHFARAFKLSVKQTPHQYVGAKRLERAKALLKGGERSLIDISIALNFSSQANFTRAFRQMTGKSPGQFRRGIS